MDRDYSSEYSDDFLELLEGSEVECNAGAADRPEFLDEAKFEAGIAFFFQNMFGILISNFRNLVVGLCVPNLR